MVRMLVIRRRAIAWGPVAASAVLLLAIGYTLVSFWQRMTTAVELSPPSKPVVSRTGPANPPVSTGAIQSLPTLHLFGQTQHTASAPAPKKLPETKLNLTLYGVLAEPDSATAGAIIGPSPGAQKSYHVGDKLPGGAILREVRAHEVVLRKNGRDEVLRFPHAKDAPVAGPTRAASPVAKPLQRLAALVRTNPQAALAQIRVIPIGAGSGFKGYRLLPGRDRALYQALGVQPGDLITRVNGVVLRGPEADRPRLAQWLRSDRIVAEVRRGGQTRMVHLDLR